METGSHALEEFQKLLGYLQSRESSDRCCQISISARISQEEPNFAVELFDGFGNGDARAHAGHLLVAEKPLKLNSSVGAVDEVLAKDVVDEERPGNRLDIEK